MLGKIVLLIGALIVAVGVAVWSYGFLGQGDLKTDRARLAPTGSPTDPIPAGFERATFGGGCFWCTEAVFQRLKGVHSVVSGYSGGSVANPTYAQVCSGTTGHAEVIQIVYDPKAITFAELLEVFWQTHDPTTLNRQGNDSGPQYRSVIFTHTDEQKAIAEQYKQQLNDANEFGRPVVTEITPFSALYPAETYHQYYFVDHPQQGYCAAVIRPKVQKFEKKFADKLR
jgi:peptide-methionine (S)-S-oxide reductase